MHRATLLPFQDNMAQEVNASDTLCIVASGIGCFKPVSVFLRTYAVEPSRGTVVLLGCTETQKKALEEELRREDPTLEMPVDLNKGNVSASTRLMCYNTERSCFATPRVFIDDLLSQRVQPDAFAGLYVFNAENVSDNSGIEFAVRLYRLGNTTGFVRAISDRPVSFASGFTKAEQVMRGLQVRSLSLWPRFQATVNADLEQTIIQVTEIAQPMTSAMLVIQDSVRDLMMALVGELNKTGTIDCSEITEENCLFEISDGTVQKQMISQLNSTWATVTWKTRQLVSDLNELCSVLWALMTRDAVDFLYYLEMIRVTSEYSIWQFHDSAHDVFQQAKRRVFVLDSKDDAGSRKNRRRKTKGVAAGRRADLRPVLEQPPKWRALKNLIAEIQQDILNSTKGDSEAEKSILVVCREMFLKKQLRLAIQDPDALLKNLFREYLELSQQMSDQTGGKKKQPATLRCDFSMYTRGELTSSLPLRDVAETTMDVALEKTPEEVYADETLIGHPLLRNVHFYSLDEKDEWILWRVKPEYVVFYSLDVAFLRQVELFQAMNLDKQVRLHLIYYDSSIEKTTFTAAVQKETNVFADLIDHKERITIPRDIGERRHLSVEKRRKSRKGVSSREREERRKIVVDVRELVSRLPATLHKADFDLHPFTLEVGDYILNPDIVVERKTVADLHSSFKSGRLFRQAKAMTEQFEIPMLLIEFDGKQFRLQSDHDIGREISSTNILSRLVLLVNHFPTLRLIWSPSTQTTCRIFNRLKRNRAEPDPVVVRRQYRRQTAEVNNQKAIDILRKLPGVTDANCQALMKSVRSLNDLSKQSLAQLEKLMESKKNAKALHGFLHANGPKE